jgi:tetratricopeptide (TPR) repeat protein
MYVVLYGKQPFRFHNLPTYRRAVQRPPEPPPLSDVPPWIHSLIERAMKQDPDERFASMDHLLGALERDPVFRRGALVLGALAAGVCIAGLAGYGQHRAELRDRCEAGATIIAGTWNRDVEQRTRTALEHAGGPHGKETAERVASRLSAYAQTWAVTYRTVAEATLLRREHDGATMDRRLDCLERGRDQLTALTDILGHANTAVAQHAVDAAFALPVPETCATSSVVSISAPPASPDLGARVRTAEHAIAEAAAHRNAGDDKVAAIVAWALSDVRAIPHPRSEAELLLLESDSKADGGDPRGALESSESAFQAAQRAGDDALAARAAARNADLLSSRLEQPQDGERWMRAAEAIANRAGLPDALHASLLASRITVNAMLGRSALNPELHDQEVALLERLYSKRDPRVARAVINRGLTLSSLGKFDRALEDIQTGIALSTAVAGPGNPHLVLDYTSLGAILVSLGRLQDAKGAYEHALALQGDAPHGSLTVTILGALAGLELELGDPDAAIEVGYRGLDAATSAGEKGALEWGLRMVIAKAKGKNGDLAGQAEDCRAILNMQKAAGALTQYARYSPDALTCLGQAELGLRRVDAALGHLEESVTFLSRSESGDLALARFALAKALRTAGRDTARARELAENAREDLRKWPALGQDLAAVELWLAEPSNAVPVVGMPGASAPLPGAPSAQPASAVPVASSPSVTSDP